MNYPRIYSLSTVGMLKHYVHDYLFHPLRTDFIGPNGVGKSVIADLMQLLFIYDTDLIQFGTDAVKNEKRSIYTLPYDVGVAYCFLNVEVSQGQFLVIGIAISAQSGTRIAPFVLVKNPELHLDISELTLSKQEIPWAKDFLVNGATIPDTKALAAKLKDRGIYLKTFRKKEDVRQYYQFLFDKEVLSINLSVDSNLKAFARVIQSFSKAKSLNLSPSAASKSLKEFLFEDEDKELLTEYDQQQTSLEKILREYSRLHKDIKSLEEKQKHLLELQRLDSSLQATEKELLITELSQLHHELKTIVTEEAIGKTALKQLHEARKLYEVKKDKLPGLEQALAEAVKIADSHVDLHSRYEDLTGRIEGLNDDINKLETLNPVTPDPDWINHVSAIDMNLRGTEQIKELVSFAVTVLKQFPTFGEIDTAWQAQEGQVSALSNELNQTKTFNERLIRMLENSAEESLLHWLSGQEVRLTEEQRAAVLYFAVTPVKKPADSTQRERFLDADALFQDFEMVADEIRKGFWLKLGALSEFVPYDPLTGSLAFTAEDLEKSKREENEIVAGRLRQLELFKRGQLYNGTILGKTFDPLLRDYTAIDKLKEAVACIQQLDNKVMALKISRTALRIELEEIFDNVPVPHDGDEPEVFKRRLKARRQQQQDRKDKITRFAVQLSGDLKTNAASITEYNQQLARLVQNALSKGEDFEQRNTRFFNRYQENLSTYKPQPLVKSVQTLTEETAEVAKEYELKYRQTADRFDETSNGTNTAVSAETTNKTFSFRVIEENLLGGRIKTTDQIAEALNAANIERLKIADEIKSNMVKVFEGTLKQYKKYKDVIYAINTFFKGRRISDRFFFKIDFQDDKVININLIEDIGQRIRNAAKQGEIAFDLPINEFIEEFFRRSARLSERIPITKLLNPKTYFTLEVKLTDENDKEIPGSTGETYSAIALLGIARLSFVQAEKRKGLRFIILEEIGSLDNSNFNTFPAIAKEFNYQIITMAPHPFRTTLADDWYAHHLIKGKKDKNINFAPSASYFKTKDRAENLQTYLQNAHHELDRTESAG
jgi:exonuclease SbcC